MPVTGFLYRLWWPWYPTVGRSSSALLSFTSIPWNLKFKLIALIWGLWARDWIVSQSDLDLLSVVEIASISLIFELCWLDIVLESSEVIFAILSLSSSLETLVKRRNLSFVVLTIDGSPCCFGERFAVKILRFDLRDVARVAWDVLCFQIGGGSSKPVISEL